MENQPERPTWEIIAQSPTLESIMPKYKMKLKYGGYFRLGKNSCKRRYCFGYQKCIYFDTSIYTFEDLVEEATSHYPSNRDLVLSICFNDKNDTEQSFIRLDSHESYQLMLTMYEVEKELTVYVTTNNNVDNHPRFDSSQNEVADEESEYSLSDDSYHSRYSSDNEVDLQDDEEEIFSNNKEKTTMKINSTFDNVIEFRRALIHYALTNEFEYFFEKNEPTRVTARCAHIECKWRIHASVMQDGITFAVKTFVETHSCTRSNKGGNKLASQGWIASVIKDKLKSDGDVSITALRKWIMKNYNVNVSYMKAWRGKEQAHNELYGKWEDSFMKMGAFKEELLKRNPGSIVDIDFERKGKNKQFLRFFISLIACSKGFLKGCRPYIALDACHLKGKFSGVLVAATSVDGNNSIFPVAYGVVESENKNSWIWFLELLKKAIAKVNEDAVKYINENHKKIWCRSKFGTSSKCDYITNNISEAFNSWIGDLRYQPVLDLLDSIREKIMIRFDKKRASLRKWKGTLVPNTKNYLNRISKKLGEYEVCRSGENRAEVKCMDKRWEVVLDEQTCTYRVWQVKGMPCLHAAAFIAFKRDANWDNYVDAYFTMEKLKRAYALEVSPMPAKDEWMHMDTEEKIHPPTIKRPPGRPRKNRIRSYDEIQTSTGKRHRCSRCGEYGHHAKTCKKAESQARESN